MGKLKLIASHVGESTLSPGPWSGGRSIWSAGQAFGPYHRTQDPTKPRQSNAQDMDVDDGYPKSALCFTRTILTITRESQRPLVINNGGPAPLIPAPSVPLAADTAG